jgi:CheY-like chemotaxis protein/two-component sensor histidine kinase
VAHALEVVERNARLQAQLVEDLLDVSRIVSGKLRMEKVPVDLRAVAEKGLEAVQEAARKRRVQLRLDLAPDPVLVLGDPHRLQQVVWNLASNAVKFGAEGGLVRVRVDGEAETARLVVADDGVGINPEFLPHVFERFQQATSGTTRAHGGLGLGLAIARHIAEGHGGQVEAASEGLGRGATFSVTLPRHPEDVPVPPGSEPAGRGEAGERALLGRNVLVVDDEPDVGDLLRHALARRGARVVAVTSVAEAVSSAEAQPPDLVLTDIGMPGSDGYALLRRARSWRTRRGRPVPVVALTSYVSPEDVARMSAEGFRGHLAKPVDPAAVAEALVSILREEERGEG